MMKSVVGLLLVTVVVANAAEVKQAYCNAYTTCRMQAYDRLKKCDNGVSSYFFSRIPSEGVAPLDRIHCEMSFKRAITSLETIFATVEKNVAKCLSKEEMGTIEDSQVVPCQSVKVALAPAEKAEDHECVTRYETDLKACEQISQCCPSFSKCYERAKNDIGLSLKESILTKKFKECLASPVKKGYLNDAKLLKKLERSTTKQTTEAPTTVASTEAPQASSAAPKVQQDQEQTQGQGQEAQQQAQQSKSVEQSQEEAQQQPQQLQQEPEEIPVQESEARDAVDEDRPAKNNDKDVDFKPDQMDLSFSLDNKKKKAEEWAADEEDDDEDEIIQLPLPEGGSQLFKIKPILQMNQTELDTVEKLRVKTAIKELRQSRKKNIQNDVGKKEEDLSTEKKVIHNILCSQFLECAAVVEQFDDDCELKFPVDKESVNGIPNRHIRWHFLNTSTTSDVQIRQTCLKNVDPISQAQIEALQQVVNKQNEKCTRDRSVGRKSAEFDGCENVGLVNELVLLARVPIDEDPKLTNSDKQQKCKDRHSELGRRCRALRSCCPDTIVCDQTNASTESSELRKLKSSMKAEQRLCEARLQRIQKAAQSGLAGLAGLNL